jgi:tetratricopeptide (TPR) repeat protein
MRAIAARVAVMLVAPCLSVQVAAGQVGAGPASASQAEAARLNACIETIASDPEAAYEDGVNWLGLGARPAARQCVALALIALGQEEEGAARLEELANAADAGSLDARAVYLAQAGNAWLVAGAPEAAIVTLTNAIKLSPRDAALRVDRARAHMTMKAWDRAGADLDGALELSPGDGEALHLRAHALLEAGRLEDAWLDVKLAMRARPADVDLLVLRGRVREAMRAKGLPDPEGLE